MFQIIDAEDVVRVEPLNFSESLNKMAEKMLKIVDWNPSKIAEKLLNTPENCWEIPQF